MPSFDPTPEQQEIIRAAASLPPGGSLKIDACAGSGKTATLAAIAEACHDWNFLYIAFNKAIVEESKKKFPKNVKASTVNALAYGWWCRKFGKPDLASSISPYDAKEILGTDDWKSVSKASRALMDFFNSDQPSCADPGAQKLLGAMASGRIPMTHDYYLKCFERRSRFPELEEYDAILLDEAQDTNDVTFSIFRRLPGRKILAGDSHQGIYGFRGAVNQLKLFQADVSLPLTVSFRCCAQAADRANFFIARYADDRATSRPMESASDGKPKGAIALLARTNAKIIDVISNLKDADMPDFRLVRSVDEVFAAADAVQAFMHGRKAQGEYSWINKFKSIHAFESFTSSAACPPDVYFAWKFVDEKGKELPEIRRKAERIQANKYGSAWLSTAHSSKGLEFDEVMILPDFMPLFIQKERLDEASGDPELTELDLMRMGSDFQQEVNLLYTAITRAHMALDDESGNYAEWLGLKDRKASKAAMGSVRASYEGRL